MKKICLLAMLAVIMLFPCVANASTVSEEVTVYDYLEIPDEAVIRELLIEKETLDSIFFALEADGIVVSENAKIEWSDITKRYIDTDIISLHTDDETTIISKLSEGSYAYEVSAFVEGYEVELTFSVGNPPSKDIEKVLTDEQYQEVLDNAGKWNLTSYGVVYEDNISQWQVTEKFNLEKYDNAIIASSQKGFNYPIVIGFIDGKATDIYPLYGLVAYPILCDTSAQPNEDGAYSFSSIPQWQEEYETYLIENDIDDGTKGVMSDEPSAGQMPVKVIVPVIIIIAVIVVIVVAVKQRRK